MFGTPIKKHFVKVLGICTLVTLSLSVGIRAQAATPSPWATQEIESAIEINLITDTLVQDFQKKLTREAYVELLVKTYEASTNSIIDIEAVRNPFEDTDKVFIVKAFEAGIATGITEKTFVPEALVTREQMVVMMMRMIEKIEEENQVKILTPTKSTSEFNDQHAISSWAKKSINLAVGNMIISGTGDENINPDGYSTSEQAIIMNYRVFERMMDEALLEKDWQERLDSYEEDDTITLETAVAKIALAPPTQIRAIVTASILNLRSEPDLNNPNNIVGKLSSNEEVTIIGEIDAWYQVKSAGQITGFVHKDYIHKYDPNQPVDGVRNQIVAYAKNFVGTRYRYGGTSLTGGVDCSGYTSQIFSKFGYALDRSSRGQGRNGVAVARNQLLPGDLVVYGYGGSISHVAIFIGNGQIIHATSSYGVRITALDGYMREPIIGYRKVIF
ncbi:NlpC/P60 family protein [Petrocella sp. FN5]|uniref:NlpC/P60 family protein n=1 Tax=Petrocella sp. FN5 TaxID=3032002 RepID=UPI0023DB2EB8|nr:NlpC/P60 family protein [Petrocella sp. FN5]MDF1617696.1 NlpC/P60 family protein [Petrocella sp. FN5]